MCVANEFIAANQRYAASFATGDLPLSPRRKAAVLTCMDARFDPARALGLEEGDAHLIRNAGGRATDDALRSLIASSVLGGTRQFVVIHHTDCAVGAISNEEARARVRALTGAEPAALDFLPFTNLDDSVREDVAKIESSPFIVRDGPVRGFVFDVGSGLLREVR